MGINVSKSVALLALLFLMGSCFVMPLSVKGSRTLVVPDDYSTIEAAIENAVNGDTVFVKAGVYEENPLEINKTLSLIGEGADSTKISFNPPYTKITVSICEHYTVYVDPIRVFADNFQMSGFTAVTTGGFMIVNGNGTKLTRNQILIDLSVRGSYLYLAKNTFSDVGFYGSHSNIVENSLLGSIVASGFYLNISGNSKASSNKFFTMDSGITVRGSSCIVSKNIITADRLYTAIFVNGNSNIVAKNRITRSEIGISASGSGNMIYGNKITDCLFYRRSSSTGLALSVSGNNTVYANHIENNAYGANVNERPENNLTSTFYHNNFIGNIYQVSVDSYFSYGNDSFDNGVEGNYWRDHFNKDTNGDGIIDTPYVIDANRSDRYPLTAPFNISSVTVELPEWASLPAVLIISPENTSYTSANITLKFTVNKTASWIGYSLDGKENVTIKGNTTLSELPDGLHNITMYARDTFENTGGSETISFTIDVPEPFPTTLVTVASATTIIVVSGGLIIYFKKRRE